ncbi:hypothetical protein GWI33_000015 [Rhynchophorus ferrugineus]|uniref:Cuticle protein n=1 Tax=Rhynchophorus ferrugineus TaxID=354439 RepID=A0A834J0I8_RHYFE|nr:hypothetical protein GWI33_000015 [Rhynchophorus ferrugineus]
MAVKLFVIIGLMVCVWAEDILPQPIHLAAPELAHVRHTSSAPILPEGITTYHSVPAPSTIAYHSAPQPATIAYQSAPAIAYQPAPVIKAIQPVAPALIKAQPAIVKQEEYDPNPQYSFGYDVHDSLTGDIKSQTETRNGDYVEGSYSLNEPDGTRRIVEYAADPVHGFNAVVHKEPLANHAIIDAAPAKIAAPLAYASPIAKISAPLAYTKLSSPAILAH